MRAMSPGLEEGRSMLDRDAAFQEHLRCLGEGYMLVRGELDELRRRHALLTVQHEHQTAALRSSQSFGGGGEAATIGCMSAVAAAAAVAAAEHLGASAPAAFRPVVDAGGATTGGAAVESFVMPGVPHDEGVERPVMDLCESEGQQEQQEKQSGEGQTAVVDPQATSVNERVDQFRPMPMAVPTVGSLLSDRSFMPIESAYPEMPSHRTKVSWESSEGDDLSPLRSTQAELSPIQAELINAGIHLHPEWIEALDRRTCSNGSLLRRGSRGIGPCPSTDGMVLRSGDQLLSTGIWTYLMVAPSSARKIFWDFCSFFMLGYDIMMIPMSAFAMAEDDMLKAVDLVITIFWTCDIVINFFTGFYDKGVLELRPRQVAKRYLKSWFVPDVAIVSSDWFVVALEVASRSEGAGDGGNVGGGSLLGMVRIGKSVRILRVLRMFRLLRILKVVQLLEDISDLFHSESLHTGFNIVKLVVAIAVVNHFIACGWFAVGNMDGELNDMQSSWVDQIQLNMLSTTGAQMTIGYKYLTSLHWSLTQFTPASMEVFPRNSAERLYAIVVILLALVMFSSFISSITSSMTHLRTLREQQRKQQENVRKYIADNKLSMDLSNRIQAFIRQNTRSSSRVRVHAVDIPVFKFLPENLSLQMHCEVFFPTLTKHPFFEAMNQGDEAGLAKVCHTAISEFTVLVGEELFGFGQKATAMYLVVGGSMEYHDGGAEKFPQGVKAGRRICEVALWAQWVHSGRLVGIATAELVLINSNKLRSVVARRRGTTAALCAEYAAQYMRHMIRVCEGLDNASDIWDDAPHLDNILQDALCRDEQLNLADRYPKRSRSVKHSIMSLASMYDFAHHASPIVPRSQ